MPDTSDAHAEKGKPKKPKTKKPPSELKPKDLKGIPEQDEVSEDIDKLPTNKAAFHKTEENNDMVYKALMRHKVCCCVPLANKCWQDSPDDTM